MASVAYLLQMRERAAARGDGGQYRALTADLFRLGFDDTTPRPIETAVPAELEHAVPLKPRGGRPKLPRCEHGNIIGRCVDCEDEEA